MVRLLAFVHCLGGGGAEKHLQRLLNNLDRGTFQLSLAVARPNGAYESFLKSDIAVYHLLRKPARSSTLQMLQSIGPLKKLINTVQPDILLAVETGASLAGLWANQKHYSSPRVAICIQNSLTNYQDRLNPVNYSMIQLMKLLYPHAHRCIALSSGVADEFMGLIPSIKERMWIIPNCNDESNNFAKIQVPLDVKATSPYQLVACGRLTRQKGFVYLIEALSIVRRVLPASLWIIGEGPDRVHLERLAHSLGISEHVKLLGFKQNPYPYMSAGDLFVLSSLWEGFGNVIIEAMASGTPVLATDCPHGPNEIITHGVNGFLVPPGDSPQLANAIVQILTDQHLKHQFKAEGIKCADGYEPQIIAAKYKDALLSMFL